MVALTRQRHRQLLQAPTKHQEDQEPSESDSHFEDVSTYPQSWRTWRRQLDCGYGILMHGLGSKRLLLRQFADALLTDGPVVALHGFIPDVQTAQLLGPLAHVVSTSRSSSPLHPAGPPVDAALPSSMHWRRCSRPERKRLLESIAAAPATPPVYVVIHSIDAPTLRSSEWRTTLRLLAGCPCIRLVASSDHVLAATLFDREAWLLGFNFWPHHVAAGAPFSRCERAALPRISPGQPGTATELTAEAVLRSLTRNAREIFAVLGRAHLERRERDQRGGRRVSQVETSHDEQQQQQLLGEGMSLPELYRVCRAKFLVTNETSLQAHVREFKDHGLLRAKRKADGGESLVVAVPNASLELLLVRMETWLD